MEEAGRSRRGARHRHPALDVRTPFFRPLWRRIATVGVLAIWAAVEMSGGSPWWAVLAGGIGLYLAHEFFWAFDPANYEDKRGEDRG